MAIKDIDYIKTRFESGDRPSSQDYVDLIETLSAKSTDLGTAGNNELEVAGIENATVIDQVPLAEWRMIKYIVSISKSTGGANKFYATEFSILIDANGDVNVAEYGSIDNNGDVGTVTITAAGGTCNYWLPQTLPLFPLLQDLHAWV